MPAYFSIDIDCNRDSLYDNLVNDFCNALESTGLKFLSGYWGFEKDTIESIIEWNQNKLEKNFVLGFSEHHSHDYKQICYEYEGFSEVRLFIINNKKKNRFGFHIIIPENDIVKWDKGKVVYVPGKVQIIIQLIKGIWILPFVETIQTSLELSCSVSIEDIKKGVLPSIEPAAIIPDNFLDHELDERYVVSNTVRNGILIQRKE